jgi:hypothetical protein
MAVIKVRWTVNELANVMSLFTRQRVWRSTAGPTGPWTEVTTPSTRVPLVALTTSYYFDDLAGAASYYYGVDYYNPITSQASGLSEPMRGDVLGYVTVGDVRAEGITATMATDAQIATGILRATAMIDQVTRQWFQPRARTFKLDGRSGLDFALNIPIVKVDSVTIAGTLVEAGALQIYNRHLTEGLLNPDDRRNPRIAWAADYDLADPYRLDRYATRFQKSFQRVAITGVFGWTELSPYDVPGETAPGSQVPVSYGETPELIKLACMRLTISNMAPLATGSSEFANAARVVQEQTRDQSIRYADTSGTPDALYGMTGDLIVDNILCNFAAPFNVGAV